MMKKTVRLFSGIAAVICISVLGLVAYMQRTLPDHFYVVKGQQLTLNSKLQVRAVPTIGSNQLLETAAEKTYSYTVDLTLPLGVKVKSAQVQYVDRKTVIACGQPFGIKMFTKGVMVVGLSDIPTADGTKNPASEAGVRVGDIILKVNGQTVSGNNDVAKLISENGDKTNTLVIKRKDTQYTVEFKSVISSSDGQYKAGIWVRDSSAGIGTMTFIDPTTSGFAGLGHPICDVDTGEILPLSSGEIVDVSITGVNKGVSGSPGELQGVFKNSYPIGYLNSNTETGIYGKLSSVPDQDTLYDVAMRQEVQEGKAQILTTLDDNTVSTFTIEIEHINFNDDAPTKNMVIHVTDGKLLEKTGGIVQGMSGSPIVQNGKIVGAVTHVFVNDPTRGYGIFSENMMNTLTTCTTE
ncbi:SpoIVB peptidase [Candidatus Soleaferrea massiliensis]|uniref:SpoIVB peptidase n=1 Tax=Candidatus Soleaferrea massiliensis TaxID=1470354 RepID=UPI0012DFF412|nr:SpoIVB peptidase [Candidatus Soleaferrea massiliensis]